MAKIMLNYRQNGRRRLGRPLRRLLDEADTGLSRPNSWRMMMMMMHTQFTTVVYVISPWFFFFFALGALFFHSTLNHVISHPRHFFFMARQPLVDQGPPHYRGFRHTTLGRTPLDQWSARIRDLYLTTNSIHKRQTSMPSEGFELTILAVKRRQTHVLVLTATGTGNKQYCSLIVIVTG